jgi:murein DD-endopeptidase MepM/ murein hydrolase activator NlpD
MTACAHPVRNRPRPRLLRVLLVLMLALLAHVGLLAASAQAMSPDTGRDGFVPAVTSPPVDQRPDRSAPRARWLWPLDPRPSVLAGFRPPSTAYGPGHRGVDLAASPAQPVRAVAAGRVSFAGVIGGKPTVAITHSDGIRSTYEPVVASVSAGDDVVVGQVIGLVAGSGSHCVATCVHLGAIRGSTYLDPLLMLGSWRVRLLPLAPF